jgi:GTPase SAR1 family protein
MILRGDSLDVDIINEFKHRKTIIIGEVNTGKTAYLGKILRGFLDRNESDMAVIDMAPEPVKGIGGKMDTSTIPEVIYYTTKIWAPRLMGMTEEEVETLARGNAKAIEDIFEQYLKHPRKILFINDVSLYLQAGDVQALLSFLELTPTVIMNGYYGHSLGGGPLGNRERQQMKILQERCESVITMEDTLLY